jgi:hypothetical protein
VAAIVPLIAVSTAAPALADYIGLGTQLNVPEFQFIGTETNVIDLLLEDCSGGVCTMATGSGFGTGVFASANGTYLFTSASASPFTLGCLGGGDFSVSQTSEIDFSYTSSNGSLTGTVAFNESMLSSGIAAPVTPARGNGFTRATI